MSSLNLNMSQEELDALPVEVRANIKAQLLLGRSVVPAAPSAGNQMVPLETVNQLMANFATFAQATTKEVVAVAIREAIQAHAALQMRGASLTPLPPVHGFGTPPDTSATDPASALIDRVPRKIRVAAPAPLSSIPIARDQAHLGEIIVSNATPETRLLLEALVLAGPEGTRGDIANIRGQKVDWPRFQTGLARIYKLASGTGKMLFEWNFSNEHSDLDRIKVDPGILQMIGAALSKQLGRPLEMGSLHPPKGPQTIQGTSTLVAIESAPADPVDAPAPSAQRPEKASSTQIEAAVASSTATPNAEQTAQRSEAKSAPKSPKVVKKPNPVAGPAKEPAVSAPAPGPDAVSKPVKVGKRQLKVQPAAASPPPPKVDSSPSRPNKLTAPAARPSAASKALPTPPTKAEPMTTAAPIPAAANALIPSVPPANGNRGLFDDNRLAELEMSDPGGAKVQAGPWRWADD